MKIKTLSLTLAIAVLFGLGGFFLGTVNNTQEASAQEACVVDENLLTRIYNSVFHRPLDSGASFHLNKDMETVLDDISESEEHEAYSALFLSLKAYEEAIRVSGDDLSEEDKEKYLDLIDSALSNAVAWAETLPEQSSEDRVVGPDRARQAIIAAYEKMNPVAQQNARKGLMRALENKGGPHNLPLPEDEEEDEEENDETSTSTDETGDEEDDETSTSTDETGDEE